MRDAFKSAGVRSPASAMAADSCPLPFPCVLKPVSLSASRGVLRVDDPSQYTEAVARIKSLLKREGEKEGEEEGGRKRETTISTSFVSQPLGWMLKPPSSPSPCSPVVPSPSPIWVAPATE
ncbi:MAG: ATP-grasp domain-containing protein [Planctomycetes bacterium]|nr:ATP-grasp domain-containing protein [Planctomycetota bacterium]